MRGVVDVLLWGTTVGSLGYAPGEDRYATFEYAPDFMESGIQISPIIDSASGGCLQRSI